MANIQRRPDGRWRVRYRDPSGKEHSKHFGRKIDADVLRGLYVDPGAGRVLFSTFARQWLAGQTTDIARVQAMEVRLRVHLEPAFGHLELRVIKPSSIQGWLAQLQRRLSPTYVRVLLANLSGVYHAAVDDRLIARNPCSAKSVRAPKIPQLRIRPWTHEQVRAVVAALPPRYAVVTAGCGLRQGEAFGLRRSDVDVTRHTLHVRQQVNLLADNKPFLCPPKGGKSREVPLPESVALTLTEHIKAFPPGRDGLIFTTREHKPLNRNYINRYV